MGIIAAAPRGIVHDFQDRLDHSQKLSDEPSWVEFYKRLWPEALVIVRIDAYSPLQKMGIDRKVIMPNGREFTIDEKKRDKDWGDLLIEEWSVGEKHGDHYAGKKVGWSLDVDKHCDFVAYAIIPSARCFLLPFELTRQTCMVNLERWKTLRPGGRKAYPLDAHNEGYLTRNCAVELDEFFRCMRQQAIRQFGSSTLQLPTAAQTNCNQIEFYWGPEV